MTHCKSRQSSKWLAAAAVFLLSTAAVFAQKTQTSTFEFPDCVVTILVPESIKVEKLGETGFKLTYNVESYVDSATSNERYFVEYTTKFNTPKDASTVTLEMSPFEKPAVLHVFNPDDKTAYQTFDESNPTIDLGTINYKGAEEKFTGQVKAILFGTELSAEQGEHVVEIRKFIAE